MTFSARDHFDSGANCSCVRCGRVGEGSWPSDFLMSADGFTCKWCAFPGQYEEDGTLRQDSYLRKNEPAK